MNITFGAVSPTRYRKLEEHFTQYVRNRIENNLASGRTIISLRKDGILETLPDWELRQVSIAKILKESDYSYSKILEIINQFAQDKKIAPNYLTKMVKILAKFEKK